MTRAADLATALDALGWFQVPRLLDQIVGVYSEALGEQTRPLGVAHGASNDDILSALANRGGPGGKGGHSDPTATLALWGEPGATDDADETIGSIDAALDLMRRSCEELDELVSAIRGLTPKPWGLDRTRQAKVATVVAYLRHLGPQLDDAVDLAPSCASHVDWLLREPIAGTATWLQAKCEAIWQASRGDIRPVAVQRSRKSCEVCTPLGRDVVPERGDRCARCKDFMARHRGLRPTAKIVRWWEDHPRSDTPPRLILEARSEQRLKQGA